MPRSIPFTKDVLEPCPFCGGQGKLIKTKFESFVICRGCGTIGERAGTKDLAAMFWNSRFIEKEGDN